MKTFKSFLAPLFEQYLIYRENLGYTSKLTVPHLKVFDRYVTDKKIENGLFKSSFFLELRADLKMEARSVNRVISSLRVFFYFLVRKGIYERNPLEDIPLAPENEIIPFLFSPDQVDQLVKQVCKNIRQDKRFYLKDFSHYMALVLIARCGLRISEPLRLMCNQYRRGEKTLYIEKTKFKKDRLIPVPMAAATELENYLAARDSLLENEPVPHLLVGCWRNRLPQSTINSTFNKAVKAIGLYQPRRVIGRTNFSAPTVHSLRHSFAVNTLKRVTQRGKSPQNALPVLAVYMGHSEYKHTVKYLKMIDANQRRGLLEFVLTKSR
jgi:integrase/recombinase XerD